MGKPEFLPADAKALLLTVIDDEHLQGLLAVRRAKRAPLSMLAVRALLKKWAQHPPGANAAVEIMAERGWTGFDVAWLPGQQRGTGQRGNALEERKDRLRQRVEENGRGSRRERGAVDHAVGGLFDPPNGRVH